ncbi:MAG: hypothetical protein RBR63_08690 [Methanosarcina vacuolata]|jgi:hypothetical protein|nr:hypothetical protein [Methanosarcina vacuolata]
MEEKRQQKIKEEISLPKDLFLDISETLKPIREKAELKTELLKKY